MTTVGAAAAVSWFDAMSVQADIVAGTAVAAALVLTVGYWARRRASRSRPGAVQVLLEISLQAADRAAQAVPARMRPRVVAVSVTIFWFVTAANWLHLVPGLSLPAPTSDINLTLALALVTMTVVHSTAVQVRGWRGYLRHYLSPWWLSPVKLLDELIKPMTLALRLFGMVFASALMLLLIGELLPPPMAVVPHTLWTLFDVFIGAIQAFIFALLTILYFTAVLPADPVAHDSAIAKPTKGHSQPPSSRHVATGPRVTPIELCAKEEMSHA
jgi:F-type H+-transporting ATPase subunit a